jgi:hypothetical protein
MTDKQIWQTIALDLKRAANYLAMGSSDKAKYYLTEARDLYIRQPAGDKMAKIKSFIKFEGNPEDILLGGSLISVRI